jgi:hypothetical protein
MAIKSPISKQEKEAISIDFSKYSHRFSKLNETSKHLTKNMKNNDMPLIAIDLDEDDYQFVCG